MILAQNGRLQVFAWILAQNWQTSRSCKMLANVPPSPPKSVGLIYIYIYIYIYRERERAIYMYMHFNFLYLCSICLPYQGFPLLFSTFYINVIQYNLSVFSIFYIFPQHMLRFSFSPVHDRACHFLGFLLFGPLGKTAAVVFVIFEKRKSSETTENHPK